MTRGILGRRLAAGAVALYALVVGVLVPLHASIDASGPGTVGVPVVEADCQDRDCHEPTHRHRGHAHDPATCVSCAQARAASAPAPAVAVVAPEPARSTAALHAVSATLVAPRHALPPARAPPVLS